MSNLLHGEITEQIIGAAFEVWIVLGHGFLEKVYEDAEAEELKRRRVKVQQQFAMDVLYKGIQVKLTSPIFNLAFPCLSVCFRG